MSWLGSVIRGAKIMENKPQASEIKTGCELAVVKKSSSIYRRPLNDFLFTRNEETDYQFSVFSDSAKQHLQENIVELQDYFLELINGVGYYSFKLNTSWITAQIVKTERLDNQRRPIYAISGNIYDLALLQENWFSFAWNKQEKMPQLSGKFCEITDGEYEANAENLEKFLCHCLHQPHHKKPISWAYGVKEKEYDRANLEFRIRFITKAGKTVPKAGILWKIIKYFLKPFWGTF